MAMGNKIFELFGYEQDHLEMGNEKRDMYGKIGGSGTHSNGWEDINPPRIYFGHEFYWI
jgi:hypothetical protein